MGKDIVINALLKALEDHGATPANLYKRTLNHIKKTYKELPEGDQGIFTEQLAFYAPAEAEHIKDGTEPTDLSAEDLWDAVDMALRKAKTPTASINRTKDTHFQEILSLLTEARERETEHPSKATITDSQVHAMILQRETTRLKKGIPNQREYLEILSELAPKEAHELQREIAP